MFGVIHMYICMYENVCVCVCVCAWEGGRENFESEDTFKGRNTNIVGVPFRITMSFGEHESACGSVDSILFCFESHL
jgi:hypothetical protein